MADCEIRSSPKSRCLRRWLLVCGWLTVLSVTYVASIGPFAYLESQGFGTDGSAAGPYLLNRKALSRGAATAYRLGRKPPDQVITM